MLLRRSFVGVGALALATPALAPSSLAHGPGGHVMSGGRYGDAGKVSRTIDVICTDNAFSLKELRVRDGETVRFVVRNDGIDPHELIIGTVAEHAEHRKMMKDMIEAQKKPGGHAHTIKMDHSSGVWVERGKTESFVWQFKRTPELEFACNIPGHYEDGMRGPIIFIR
jgi:uncharacterized cupredoxin-like copper-binding protein